VQTCALPIFLKLSTSAPSPTYIAGKKSAFQRRTLANPSFIMAREEKRFAFCQAIVISSQETKLSGQKVGREAEAVKARAIPAKAWMISRLILPRKNFSTSCLKTWHFQ